MKLLNKSYALNVCAFFIFTLKSKMRNWKRQVLWYIADWMIISSIALCKITFGRNDGQMSSSNQLYHSIQLFRFLVVFCFPNISLCSLEIIFIFQNMIWFSFFNVWLSETLFGFPTDNIVFKYLFCFLNCHCDL